MKSLITSILLFLVVFTSCSSREASEEAIKLNDRAVRIFVSAMMDTVGWSTKMDSALFLLNSAIDLDKNNRFARLNKADVLMKLHRYQEALKTLTDVIVMDSEYVEVVLSQAFIYEKMGNTKSADSAYAVCLDIYQKRIKKDPKNLNNQMGRIFAMCFIDYKKAISEFNTFEKNHPYYYNLEMNKQTIMNFDRKEFINGP